MPPGKRLPRLWRTASSWALSWVGVILQLGHFIVLRGITEDGKILVADPASRRKSEQEWDFDIILNEVQRGAGAGGPFWIISQ